MPSCLDVCIPFFNDDPVALIAELAQQQGAAHFRLSLCDDGSCQPDLTARVVAALDAYPGPAVLHTLPQNTGRANARNVMLLNLRADWVLLLDADMALDRPDFVAAYQNAAQKFGVASCIVGGFRVDPSDVTDQTRLHAAQSKRSECKPAAQRARDPGRHVYSSSVFVHRSIVAQNLFDPLFHAWGWEDVEWGLRIVKDNAIFHIDNPARHKGLEPDDVLVAKYAGSVANFRRIKALHPISVAQMPIARVARAMSALPFLRRICDALKAVALSPRLPVRLRLYALKLYRAGRYASVYRER